MKKFAPFLLAAAILAILQGCSREKAVTYDELVASGGTEARARKTYAGFFKAIDALGEAYAPDKATPDSTIIKNAARQTDTVIEQVRSFPKTFESRISLDALSYAAADLMQSKGFDSFEVSGFWRNGLLDPMFIMGGDYVKNDIANDSTLLQLVLAIKRGMGEKATSDMLLDAIAIVGPNPSEQVMKECETDSLVFRKVYDLLVYSRSLQEMGPPVWMMTGPWFVAIAIEGWPLGFYCIKPLNLNNSFYLTFRSYTQGQMYASVFNDPAPKESAAMDAWLSRAAGAMDSLKFNDSLAARVFEQECLAYPEAIRLFEQGRLRIADKRVWVLD